jgi:hypothetical protein
VRVKPGCHLMPSPILRIYLPSRKSRERQCPGISCCRTLPKTLHFAPDPLATVVYYLEKLVFSTPEGLVTRLSTDGFSPLRYVGSSFSSISDITDPPQMYLTMYLTSPFARMTNMFYSPSGMKHIAQSSDSLQNWEQRVSPSSLSSLLPL